MVHRAARLLPLAAFVAACSGPDTPTKPTGTSPTGDDDDDVVFDLTGGETAAPYESPWFEPVFLLVEGNFGFNTLTGVVDVGTPYGDEQSGVVLTLAEAEWEDASFDPAATEYYCQILLPLVQGALPTWVLDQGLYFGVQYDRANEAGTNCNTAGYELDPNVWGYGPDFGYASVDWGIGVGDLSASYASSYATSDYIDNFLGGYVDNEILPAPKGTTGYLVIAYEIDAGNQIVVNEDGELNPLLAADVAVGAPPAPLLAAAYHLLPLYIWAL